MNSIIPPNLTLNMNNGWRDTGEGSGNQGGWLIYLDYRQYSFTLQLIINALWGEKSLKILILEKVI
jgi:hypothetical protein